MAKPPKESEDDRQNSVLADVLPRGENNYDLIRLLLAIAVVFGHSFAISRNDLYNEPILQILKFDYIGNLAVYGFFLLSGLFVTESYIKNKSALVFTVSRCLRIYPGLFVCLLSSAYLIGLASTNWTLHAYLQSPEVSDYIISGMKLYMPQWDLPGVFEGNSIRGVNGSIWTLIGEVFCYICILTIGVLRIFSNRQLAIFILVFLFFFVASDYSRIFYFSAVAGFKLPFMFFIAGSLFALLKKNIPLNFTLFTLLTIAMVITKHMDSQIFRWYFYAFFAYGIIFLGQLDIAKRINLSSDISYGVYLYGFPVQQLCEFWFTVRNPWLNFLLSMPLVFGFAYVSWFFVERPMIKLATEINSLIRGDM